MFNVSISCEVLLREPFQSSVMVEPLHAYRRECGVCGMLSSVLYAEVEVVVGVFARMHILKEFIERLIQWPVTGLRRAGIVFMPCQLCKDLQSPTPTAVPVRPCSTPCTPSMPSMPFS